MLISAPKETIDDCERQLQRRRLSLIAIALGVPAASSVGWHHRLISVGVLLPPRGNAGARSTLSVSPETLARLSIAPAHCLRLVQAQATARSSIEPPPCGRQARPLDRRLPASEIGSA